MSLAIAPISCIDPPENQKPTPAASPNPGLPTELPKTGVWYQFFHQFFQFFPDAPPDWRPLNQCAARKQS